MDEVSWEVPRENSLGNESFCAEGDPADIGNTTGVLEAGPLHGIVAPAGTADTDFGGLTTAEPISVMPLTAEQIAAAAQRVRGQSAAPVLDLLIIGLERTFALAVLVVTSPLLALIALAIRLDSRGGAIFTQRRVALMDPHQLPEELAVADVPTFTLYKFRTYFVDGDRLVPKRARFEFDPQQIDGVHLQLKDDPRITRVGRFLRRTSLDELPNFLNILKGEMRLIGPRPEVPQMYPYYTVEQRVKFTVKPGITGLAQVNGRGKLTFKETVDYDVYYVRNRTRWFNLKILLKTVKVVLLGDGSF